MVLAKGHKINLGRIKGPMSEVWKQKIVETKAKITALNLNNGVLELSNRKGTAIVVCEKCGKKREVRYDTGWKINAGKNRNICRRCIKLGRKLTPAHRKKIGDAERGSMNGNWKGGKTPLLEALRSSVKYKEWRYAVFSRDGFCCKHCGDKRGHNLNAHHIKMFSTYEELRFEINNGITLCEKCHIKIHSSQKSLVSAPIVDELEVKEL